MNGGALAASGAMLLRWYPILCTIKSKAVRSVIVGLVVIGLCYAVSLLGLSTIISKIYGYDGYYALIVVVLPAFIWGIPKIKKLSAEKKAELSE